MVVVVPKWSFSRRFYFISFGIILKCRYRMEDNDAVQTAQQFLSKTPINSSSLFQQRSKTPLYGSLPSQFLHHQQKLYQRVKDLNDQGILLIEKQNYSQALLCFGECEKILEYAASCGKTLDRNIILTVLHNEALVFQRCDSYQKSARYVEAIIYNLNASLEAKEYFHFLMELEEYYFEGSTSNEKDVFIKGSQALFGDYKRKKQEAVMYYLQFAGLQSQYQNHEESLGTAQKALANLKELFQWCQRFQRLSNDRNQAQYHRLKDLSLTSLQFSQSQYTSLKKQFDKLLNEHIDQSKSKTTLAFCEKSMKIDLQEIFSLCPRVVKESYYSQIDFYGEYLSLTALEGGVKRIFMLAAIYFTIGVEIEEICAMEKKDKCSSIYLVGGSKAEEKEIGNIQSEMYNLMALIICFKYLPPQSNLLTHILQIYQQTYKKPQQSPIPSYQKSINKNLDMLTQKYKNYLVQKQISLSLDDGSSSIIKADPQQQKKWNQQKKQSKKLNELFKQQPIHTNFRSQQQNYFLQVPSIDSISIANSNSKTSFKLQTSSSIDDPKNLQFNHKKKKVFFNTKSKPSKMSIEYDLDHKGGHSNIKDYAEDIISQKSREDQNIIDSKKIKSAHSQQKKSKSMKKNKSKMKLIETKKIEKSPNNTMQSIPVIGLMTTITERSSKKLKSKKSVEKDIKHIMGSAGQEYSKWMGESKKIISSEQMKPFRSNQFGSVKQIPEQIRLNKVKAPSNTDLKSGNTVRFQRPRPFQPQIADRTSKNKSKSKNSASFKSKKSTSNSKTPLPAKKSLTKTITTSKDKIYTSIKQTIRKR